MDNDIPNLETLEIINSQAKESLNSISKNGELNIWVGRVLLLNY